MSRRRQALSPGSSRNRWIADCASVRLVHPRQLLPVVVFLVKRKESMLVNVCLASHVSLEVNSATSKSCSAAPGFSRPDLLEEILAMLHDRHYDHVVIQQTKEYVLSTVGIMGCTIFSLPFNWNSKINSWHQISQEFSHMSEKHAQQSRKQHLDSPPFASHPPGRPPRDRILRSKTETSTCEIRCSWGWNHFIYPLTAASLLRVCKPSLIHLGFCSIGNHFLCINLLWVWPPHTATTRINRLLCIGNPYRPSFSTVTGRGHTQIAYLEVVHFMHEDLWAKKYARMDITFSTNCLIFNPFRLEKNNPKQYSWFLICSSCQLLGFLGFHFGSEGTDHHNYMT